MTELRLATRSSPLAMAQARLVADDLAKVGVGSRLVEVETTGDVDRLTPVATLTEVGAFVRSIQVAVIDGRADVAVHSGKDLPTDGPPELEGRHPQRAAPWDVLCGHTLSGLPEGARVGTGSPRRSAQLRALRPDLDIVDMRGNVGTRLSAVANGVMAAVVLAEAGLERLGLTDAIDHRFSATEMVPAPAQAALTLEFRAGTPTGEIVGRIEDDDTRRALTVERGLLAATGAGCRSALGCLAEVRSDGSLDVRGFVEDERGARSAHVEASDPPEAIEMLRSELGV